MALRIEAEILVEFFEPAPNERDFLSRPGQCLTGPETCMHSYSNDLALLTDRNDHKVEGHPAMHARLALSLGHERDIAAILEIAHRSERAAFVGRQAGDTEN